MDPDGSISCLEAFTIHDSRFGVSKEAGEIHREWSRSRVGRIVCETRHAAVEPVVSFSDE